MAEGRPKVAVLDFRYQEQYPALDLSVADCEVFSVSNFPVDRLGEFSGFFLSNGPGDPADVEGPST